MSEYVIQTSGLCRSFGDFKAVDNLDLKVKKGEIYGLLGPNGAGKTTTIKMLVGLLPKSGGQASVMGIEIPPKPIAHRIGYMPQETALYIGLTIHQNLAFFGRIFDMSDDEIAGREKELLAFVDLEDWRDALVSNLSGGMKHRASLACAMMPSPEILFLDEPTVGVDPELRVAFWEFFGELKAKGTTILLTTHYMDEARHCDRIGFMRRGALIAEGEPAALMVETGTDSLEDTFLAFSKGGGGR